MYYINSTIVLGISVPKDCGGTSTSTYGFTVRLYLLSGGLCLRPVESEVLSSFSCTLNPHFFRRNFCMLRCTQLYSNPCISCIFWLHHACRSTAAHAAGSGRAAADEPQAWRTAGVCAAFTHNSPDLRTSSGDLCSLCVLMA